MMWELVSGHKEKSGYIALPGFLEATRHEKKQTKQTLVEYKEKKKIKEGQGDTK